MYQAAWKLLVIMCHNISPSLSFLFSFNCAIYSLWQLVPNMEHPLNKELLRGAYKRAQTLRLTQRSATLRLHAYFPPGSAPKRSTATASSLNLW